MEPLEDDLRNELHVELFAGTKARCAIEVTDRVSDHAESIGGSRGACVSAGFLIAGVVVRRIVASYGHRPDSGSEIEPVKEIKDLGSKLYFHALGDGNVLDDRQIHGSISRSIEFVAGDVPEG